MFASSLILTCLSMIFEYVGELDLSKNFALPMLYLQHESPELKANSIKLDCSIHEDNSSMGLLSTSNSSIGSKCNHLCKVGKLFQHTQFSQAPSSQNHATVKPVQACCRMNFS